jgi:sugar phosphate isomerase/epimerase
MRLGGGIEKPYKNPREWAALVKELGYSCVLSPVDCSADSEVRKAYIECAKEQDLVIGEAGVWRNVLSSDEAERKAAIEYSINQLALAEELGAACCVNISGSRGEVWDGCCADNYSSATWDLVVETTRNIIDAVKPKHTFYTIESMPWMIPDSPDEYLRLIKAVDRPVFGVHLDYVNMINCPRRWAFRDNFITECFTVLGPYIKSVHAKDAYMEHAYSTVIHETMPGKGQLDFGRIAKLCERLGPDIPVFVEHLPDFESYKKAAAYVRSEAEKAGVRVK